MAKKGYGLKDFAIDICKLPNRITLFRIVGFFVLFLPFYYYNYFFTAFVIFLLLAATDWLDGFLARRKKMLTWLGRGLDPVADKVLFMGAMFTLGLFKIYPFPGLLLVALEGILFVIGVIAFFGFHENLENKIEDKIKNLILGANIFGKTKAVIETVIISSVFLKKLEILQISDGFIILIFWVATLAATMSILGHLNVYILKLRE